MLRRMQKIYACQSFKVNRFPLITGENILIVSAESKCFTPVITAVKTHRLNAPLPLVPVLENGFDELKSIKSLHLSQHYPLTITVFQYFILNFQAEFTISHTLIGSSISVIRYQYVLPQMKHIRGFPDEILTFYNVYIQIPNTRWLVILSSGTDIWLDKSRSFIATAIKMKVNMI